MKRNLIKVFVLCIGVFLVGCTNSNNKNSMGSLNAYYNNVNKTQNRSMVMDTVIATTLYNYPELIPRIGIGKTRSKTKTNVNSISNTVSNSQYFSNGSSSFGQSQSKTTTKTHSKSTTKSVTTGIGISPNLDFYLK